MDHCWLMHVWVGWLLYYFLRSEANFDISQNILNQILTAVWVYKNFSSNIIILGESHFSIFRFLYSLSNNTCHKTSDNVQARFPPTFKQPSAYKSSMIPVPVPSVFKERSPLHVNLLTFPKQTIKTHFPLIINQL